MEELTIQAQNDKKVFSSLENQFLSLKTQLASNQSDQTSLSQIEQDLTLIKDQVAAYSPLLENLSHTSSETQNELLKQREVINTQSSQLNSTKKLVMESIKTFNTIFDDLQKEMVSIQSEIRHKRSQQGKA